MVALLAVLQAQNCWSAQQNYLEKGTVSCCVPCLVGYHLQLHACYPSRLQVRHVLFSEPESVQAGEEVTIWYNPNDTPLNGKNQVGTRLLLTSLTACGHATLMYQFQVLAQLDLSCLVAIQQIQNEALRVTLNMFSCCQPAPVIQLGQHLEQVQATKASMCCLHVYTHAAFWWVDGCQDGHIPGLTDE